MSDDEIPGKTGDDSGTSTPSDGGPAAKNPPSTVLSDLMNSVVGALQENLSGDDTTGVQNTVAALLQNVSDARKRQAKHAAAVATKVPSIDGADDDEASKVVQLDSVRSEKAPRGIDMRALVDQAVRAFAMDRLEGESAPEEVRIDGDFVAHHGGDLVKAVAGAVGEAWVGALAGVDMSARQVTPDDDLNDPDELEDAPEVPVRYDMLSIVASLLRPPSRVAAASSSDSSDDAPASSTAPDPASGPGNEDEDEDHDDSGEPATDEE